MLSRQSYEDGSIIASVFSRWGKVKKVINLSKFTVPMSIMYQVLISRLYNSIELAGKL